MTAVICEETRDLLWEETAMGGRPTEECLMYYTEGDCWVLAWHLQRVLQELGEEAELWTVGPVTSWTHVVVKLADGRYMDINGVHSGKELEADWWGVLTKLPAQLLSFGGYKKLLDMDFNFPAGHGEAELVARNLAEAHFGF